MHLGLIGGIGPAATEFYYRGLVRAYAALGETLDLTIANASSQPLLENMARGAAEEQARIFLGFVERLEAAGADVAVVTSLSGHFCIEELAAVSPLPLLDALPALDAYFAAEGIERVGLLGTRTVLESRLHGGVHSTEIVIPQGDDLQRTHDTYVAMASAASATDAQKETMLEMGRALCREQGADAVALAGTDLFLVFEGAETDYRVVDCASVHIEDIVSRALHGKPAHPATSDS